MSCWHKVEEASCAALTSAGEQVDWIHLATATMASWLVHRHLKSLEAQAVLVLVEHVRAQAVSKRVS